MPAASVAPDPQQVAVAAADQVRPSPWPCWLNRAAGAVSSFKAKFPLLGAADAVWIQPTQTAIASSRLHPCSRVLG